MENSKFRQRLSAAALSCTFLIAATLVIAWAIDSASGQHPAGSTGGRNFGGRRKSPANIRLNFFNADWSTVLKKVAESSQSTLVMQEVPKGRFTRIDHRKYNRTEVVRILNRELEPKGFRLLEKGRFLDVIYLRSARSEYRRREMPRQLDDVQKRRSIAIPKTRSRKPQRSVYTIPRRRQTLQTAASVQTTRDNPQPPRRETFNPLATLQKSQPRAVKVEQAKIIRVIRPRVRRAEDIARTIYKSLKTRSRLVDRGPGGLPAFHVYQSDDNIQQTSARRHTAGMPMNRVQFSVGIDTGRNELVIDAPPILNQNVGELIRYLDSASVRKNETIRLVPTNTDPAAIADALRQPLRMLAQLNARNGNQPLPKQPAAKPGKEIQKVIPRALGGLNIVFPVIRGRVIIRDVPGVGLVITGPEKAVDAVMELIKALDFQARVTVPNVHIELLRHVNSQAIAELLTAVYLQLNSIRTGTTTTQRAGPVAFIPVVRPNAILILSSKNDLEPALKLIADLDRPVDPQKEFRIFRLRYAVASQVVANLDALFQQQQGQQANQQQGLAARVRAIADVRTNSVIVEAHPNDMAAVANLIHKFDQERVDSVSRLKTFQLKNAVATELADLINTAIQSVINPPTTVAGGVGGGAGTGGQASQQLRDAKSSILEFMAPSGDNKRLIRSGILADIR
ncbi:MAG: hypothetical protein IID45_10710, partial [Planctomycetes bacterium]|nr:hypothetical protein [Planctomycetota bacterium]